MLIQMIGGPKHIQVSHDILHAGVYVKTGNPSQAMNEMTAQDVADQLFSFNQIAYGHVPYKPGFVHAIRDRPTFVIFLIRDPRDVIVSHLGYVTRFPDRSMNYIFMDGSQLSERPDPIADLIRLSPTRWRMFEGWLREADLVLTFEEMVRTPMKTCELLITLIGTDALGTESPQAIFNRIDSAKSPTFWKGKTGGWQDAFTDDHNKTYLYYMKRTHRRLGYSL